VISSSFSMGRIYMFRRLTMVSRWRWAVWIRRWSSIIIILRTQSTPLTIVQLVSPIMTFVPVLFISLMRRSVPPAFLSSVVFPIPILASVAARRRRARPSRTPRRRRSHALSWASHVLLDKAHARRMYRGHVGVMKESNNRGNYGLIR